MRISELATHLGVEIHWGGKPGDDVDITAVAPIENATAGQVTFIANAEYAKFASSTRASAIIVGKAIEGVAAAQLVHKNPYYAFARTAQLFWKEDHGPVGVSPHALVDKSARLGRDVTVHPFVVVGPEAVIGDRVVLYPGCYLGRGASIDDDSVLHANVVIEHGCRIGKRAIIHAGTVVGADGFGFAPGDKGIAKIPQTGIAVVGDDVEMGAHVSIDRAAMGETRLGNGCKLDDKVHIAHNVVVGQDCMFSGMSGIAGSAKVGSRVILGGQAAVNGHITVMDDVVLGGLAGMTKSPKEPGLYMGFPAVPAVVWRKQEVYLRRLPDMDARIKELEERVADLMGRLEANPRSV